MQSEQATPHRTDTWDEFLTGSRPDIGFMQRSWWARLLQTRGWGHFGAFFKADGEILGGARVLTKSYAPGKSFYYVPEGPVLPDDDDDDAAQLFDAFINYIDAHRRRSDSQVTHLRIEPRWSNRPRYVQGCREAGSWLEPRNTLEIDLRATECEILAQMKPKGRYNIGLARRHGVSVIQDLTADGLDTFVRLYLETFDRHRLAGEKTEYLRSLCASLRDGGNGSLFHASYRGQILSTALIVYCGDRATYLFGGSRAENRQVMSPYLLHFEAMLAAKSRGCTHYDFYGISPPLKTGHAWADITAFKRKFGGTELNFVRSLDFIFDRQGYDEYRNRIAE